MKKSPSSYDTRSTNQRDQNSNRGSRSNSKSVQLQPRSKSILHRFRAALKKFTFIFRTPGKRILTDIDDGSCRNKERGEGRPSYEISAGSCQSKDVPDPVLTNNTSQRQSDSLCSSTSSSRDTGGSVGLMNFSLEDVRRATQNFAPDNMIGQGGMGTVFKGKLKDGSLIAVKRARKSMREKPSMSDFNNEILALSKIEHMNLVRLYGYVEHMEERIIVMEYVGNGTLREHLDGKLVTFMQPYIYHHITDLKPNLPSKIKAVLVCTYIMLSDKFSLIKRLVCHVAGARGQELELAERLDIAIDVAHGITYLHSYNDPPIIHRDIKASNILITEKLKAKVADFGLARILPDQDVGATHVTTAVKGTTGYLDPEYLKTYQLNEKSDVYSFGVLLVELVTGRHPLEMKKGVKERVTIRWAMQKLRYGDSIMVMDPRLRRSPASTTAVEKVLKLSQKCLNPVRQSRPTMRKCVADLWVIRKEFNDRTAKSKLSHPSSYRSVDLTENDARKERNRAMGIREDESHTFISA